MVQVTPMLRQLLGSLAARQTSEAEVEGEGEHPPVARLSDKLARRQRQIELGLRLPKSVCTSLRDICEM
jgi:hypothetical protein